MRIQKVDFVVKAPIDKFIITAAMKTQRMIIESGLLCTLADPTSSRRGKSLCSSKAAAFVRGWAVNANRMLVVRSRKKAKLLRFMTHLLY